MALSWENTKVDGEAMRLFVGLPDGSGPFPALVVIQHQGGVDEFVQDMVKKATSAGYVSVAPDLYHRDPPDCQDDGPTRRGRLRDLTVVKDVNAAVDFLKGHKSVDPKRLGIIGFCMGGRVSYLSAAANSSFKAAVAYYGGNILVPWGEGPSPFDRTGEIHCSISDQLRSASSMPRFWASLITLLASAANGFLTDRTHSFALGKRTLFLNLRTCSSIRL